MNMTTDELQRLESLVLNAECDKETALQLAIDATKLLAVTKENLDDYKGHEFFKHCLHVFCGEQDSIDEVDENSLTTVQRMAFAYLMKLKEQNLIDEQDIAAEVQKDEDEAIGTAAQAILSQGHLWSLGASLGSGMSKEESQKKFDQIIERIDNNADDCNSNDPRAILKRLRGLHDQLGDQIGEIEDAPEDAARGLENIYTEMETQLDALESALEDDETQSDKDE